MATRASFRPVEDAVRRAKKRAIHGRCGWSVPCWAESMLPTASPSLGRVLVVEDDRAFSSLLSQHLERQHLDVVCASSGLAALNLIRANPSGFDLIVSDMRMPRLGGLDLLALLRSDGTIPFILMTAFADPMTTEMAAELGAIAVLSKPFELEALTELALGVLQQRHPN